ncbi:hypothetical protein K458DRAFT_126980 [Lentithecium fluviatile CBS 122367]|uniref:Uncharacterized protein n=1 Tax=Lentithecium fluviatile CBS 122367 TaxID=1168545 RepID=A0A6G1JFX2_9PLEO|nr:hypothetical protein K458DRAFT_126980 [Lentithecium fluviatile CBS 122367]
MLNSFPGTNRLHICKECSSSLPLSERMTDTAIHLSMLTPTQPTIVPTTRSESDSEATLSSFATPASPETVTTSPPAPTAQTTNELNIGVKIGIGIAAGVLALALLIVAFESCYLKLKRRERALQRAVDEVERGTDKGGEERIVLESRVSIVFEDEDQGEEHERGRNGMSLPRRE